MGTLPILAAPAVPLVKASHSFLGAAAPPIISAGALIGIFGTLNVIMLACTRLPFAMAVQGQLPVQLARVHRRFLTPHVSILVSEAARLGRRKPTHEDCPGEGLARLETPIHLSKPYLSVHNRGQGFELLQSSQRPR